MLVKFCLDDGGDELFEIKAETLADVSGIIEAAKGQKVVFHREDYKYDSHILNHYNDGGKWETEVIVYLVKY